MLFLGAGPGSNWIRLLIQTVRAWINFVPRVCSLAQRPGCVYRKL